MTPSRYAARLLDGLGFSSLPVFQDDRSAETLWRDSGAMWLSGLPELPPRHCAAPAASAMQGAWLALCALCPSALDSQFSAYQLLGERAALAGFARGGQVSAGGAAYLLPTIDGWIALNLARDDDWALMPAWLEQNVNSLVDINVTLKSRQADTLVARGRAMGLAVASLPAQTPRGVASDWVQRQRLAPSVNTQGRQPLVVDLSSLWAGPLCGQLLRECGARVIKVESVGRPDGARFGPAAFYDLMNAGKASVALSLDHPEGLSYLRGLLAKADIVIEGSRPRALRHMGIDALDLVARGTSKVWVSITGYGRQEPYGDWIAFGDDAGAAAGLSNAMGSPPVFCADAIADPLTGLHAAVAAMCSWQQGGGEILDVSLFAVARSVAALSDSKAGQKGQSVAACANGVETTDSVALPHARTVMARAPSLGANTRSVLQELFGMSNTDYGSAAPCVY